MAEIRDPDPLGVLPLHPLEFRVLLVLMEGELHGYGIAKEIERRDARLGKIFPTNLYRRLRDMAGRGLIDEDPATADGEHRRRLYRITKFGHLVAREEALRLESLVGDARQKQLLAPPSTDG
jgi:DNA-binding PadR family transcriptional regulator